VGNLLLVLHLQLLNILLLPVAAAAVLMFVLALTDVLVEVARVDI
jgi:hypothetical protein